jgi:hypothetical protein
MGSSVVGGAKPNAGRGGWLNRGAAAAAARRSRRGSEAQSPRHYQARLTKSFASRLLMVTGPSDVGHPGFCPLTSGTPDFPGARSRSK